MEERERARKMPAIKGFEGADQEGFGREKTDQLPRRRNVPIGAR